MKKLITNRNKLYAMFVSGLFVTACGGGGGGGGEPEVIDTNQKPVAEAGTDMLVSRNFTVNLDGSGSSDADGDALSFTWIQTSGPDVTGGAGSLSGESPAFQAPAEVATLGFNLIVNDGQEDSEASTVIVNVLEDVNVAYFVDGDNGNDQTGTGSMDNPFASIAKALCEVTQEQQDIYVITRSNDGVYDETSDPCPGDVNSPRSTAQILAIPTGTSLYGGYSENWIRNATDNRTAVDTLHHGFRFSSVNLNAWFSGFKVNAADSPNPEDSVYAVSALGGDAGIHIQNNELTAGNVGVGGAPEPGSSYGLMVALIDSATIQHNLISSGFGGDGLDVGITFNDRAQGGADGGDATSTSGAGGGDGRGPLDYDGGRGGDAGTQGGENGDHGSGGEGPAGQGGCGGGQSSGAYDCRGDSGGGQAGRPGQNGGGGSAGDSGAGGSGAGSLISYNDGGFFAYYAHGRGARGASGTDGAGAGGGGGGEAEFGANGGGGGGGGGGGAGGAGGFGGPGGGASIALFIAAVNNPVISDNDISSSVGGFGAGGGQGQLGGLGGAGGDGANGNRGLYTGGNGGDGGTGGTGGTGGRGGAGGGGPSYGIAIGSNTAPTISNNVIASGDGGYGGFGGEGGHGGMGGDSYAVFDNDIADGMVPVLSNNTFNPGLPGNGGGTTGTGGSIGDVGQSGASNW